MAWFFSVFLTTDRIRSSYIFSFGYNVPSVTNKIKSQHIKNMCVQKFNIIGEKRNRTLDHF